MEFGNPHQTIYVQNLNERVQPQLMKDAFSELFEQINLKPVNMVVKKRLALKGQAWIQFESTEAARKAIEHLQGRRLWGKTTVVRFARFKSDSVSKTDGTYETEKYHRDQEKAEKARNPRPTRRQIMQQSMINPTLGMMPGMGGQMQPPAMMSIPMGVGSDMQLPNKILFLQALPAGVTETMLSRAFGRHPGFVEVRPVPNRPDLTFVEYEAEGQAAMARASLDRTEILPGAPLQITFARR